MASNLNAEQIKEIFERFKTLKVGVIGDFAVDYYFDFNKITQEFSVETQKEVFWASHPKTYLGAAGNVVQNLADLGINHIEAFGYIGNDLFGREMLHLLHQKDVKTQNLKIIEGVDTCTYSKPLVNKKEDNRIDYGTNNQLSENDFDSVLESLKSQLPNLNLLVINQQFPNPLLNKNRIEKLNEIIKQFPNCICVADTRAFGKFIRHSTLKVNTNELAKLLNINHLDESDTENCIANGKVLNEQINCPILLTRGENGILYINNSSAELVDAIKISGEIDTVGAGDTVLSAFSACIGAKASVGEAIQIANLAAAVTVQKINQTGTASLSEILELVE
jgi:rfaE bifunctional protein kinase chain/domain